MSRVFIASLVHHDAVNSSLNRGSLRHGYDDCKDVGKESDGEKETDEKSADDN